MFLLIIFLLSTDYNPERAKNRVAGEHKQTDFSRYVTNKSDSNSKSNHGDNGKKYNSDQTKNGGNKRSK